MVKVTYIEHDGAEHKVEASPGLSLMEVAKQNNVDGILADCGGACACATCHVIVDAAWADKLPPIEDTEETMLEFGLENREALRSRLSCQIQLTEEMDGLVLHVPEEQL